MRTLEFGAFLGHTDKQLSRPELVLCETAYADGLVLPLHSHAHASYCLTLSGGWCDDQDGRRRECAPGDVLYRPAGITHAQRFVRSTRCLNLDLDASWARRVRPLPRAFAHFGRCSEPTRLLTRLHRELRTADDLSGVAAEGLCLELLAATARVSDDTRESKAPPWLATAEEFLRARAFESTHLAEVAAAVGVSTSRIVRGFRRHLRCSVPEYVRRLRVERASALLRETELSVAEIAVQVGFCDQSHLNRQFRAQLGISPGAFRSTVGRPIHSQPFDLSKTHGA